MHMGVRDEQVIEVLSPSVHPAPAMQAEMKWERSYFLPGQSNRLAARATYVQSCWLCHGFTAFSVSTPFRVINNRRQMEVWGLVGFFLTFLVGIHSCEKFAIKLASIKQREGADARQSSSMRKPWEGSRHQVGFSTYTIFIVSLIVGSFRSLRRTFGIYRLHSSTTVIHNFPAICSFSFTLLPSPLLLHL